MSFRRVIKSIQYGTCVISNGSTGAVSAAFTAVVLANSVIRFLGASTPGNSGSGSVYASVRFNSTTDAFAQRTFTNGDTTVGFVVIEYYPGILKSNQNIAISIPPGGGTGTQVITAVNVAMSEMVFGGSQTTDNSSGQGQNWIIRFSTLASALVTAAYDSGVHTATIWGQVIEFN